VKILAIAATQRLDLLPDVPTMPEFGYPGIISATWNIMSAPPGTPPDVVSSLNRSVETVLSNPKVQAQFAKLHMSVVGGSSGDAKRHVASDREHWARIIKAANIRPQ
jgi:tripartite-type tricarboxylate transporter receptor subunit TctC